MGNVTCMQWTRRDVSTTAINRRALTLRKNFFGGLPMGNVTLHPMDAPRRFDD